jgi:Flp pilus assembly pilin Flp
MKSWNKSRFKKLLCRLMGDRAGGVMMEYVILAVLIAAAAVLAVMYFGRGVVTNLTTSTHAMAGQSEDAAVMSETAKAEATSAETENEDYRKRHADK